MRFLVTLDIDTKSGNALVTNPTFGEKLQSIFQEQKAEAVYFHPRNGNRGITYVAQITDGSKIPWLLEPWWVIGASRVEATPCFTPPEMAKAMPDVAALAKKYAP